MTMRIIMTKYFQSFWIFGIGTYCRLNFCGLQWYRPSWTYRRKIFYSCILFNLFPSGGCSRIEWKSFILLVWLLIFNYYGPMSLPSLYWNSCTSLKWTFSEKFHWICYFCYFILLQTYRVILNIRRLTELKRKSHTIFVGIRILR